MVSVACVCVCVWVYSLALHGERTRRTSGRQRLRRLRHDRWTCAAGAAAAACPETSSLGVALVTLVVTKPSVGVVVVGNNSSSTGTVVWFTLVELSSGTSVTFRASDNDSFCAYTLPLAENMADTSTKTTKSDIFVLVDFFIIIL